MKKILIPLLMLIIAMYLFFFVFSKSIDDIHRVSITSGKKNNITIHLTDSYYFITSVSMKYSGNKDSLYLSCRRSTLANIFYYNKLGYRILDIDSSVKIITFCGVSIPVEKLPIDLTEECTGAIPPEDFPVHSMDTLK
jgi:uncharacterized protein YxeA